MLVQARGKTGSGDDSAREQAHDVVRSLQIASLLERLRSAVDEVDVQLAATLVCMRRLTHIVCGSL